jgi:hypothetical protein
MSSVSVPIPAAPDPRISGGSTITSSRPLVRVGAGRVVQLLRDLGHRLQQRQY